MTRYDEQLLDARQVGLVMASQEARPSLHARQPALARHAQSHVNRIQVASSGVRLLLPAGGRRPAIPRQRSLPTAL